jgi:hypothetical protein
LIILIILGEEYKLWSSSICNFLQTPVTSSLFSQNIILSNLFSNILSLYFSLNVENQVPHSYKTTGKFITLNVPIFTFLDRRRVDLLRVIGGWNVRDQDKVGTADASEYWSQSATDSFSLNGM